VSADGLSGLTIRLPRGGTIRGRIVGSPNPAGHFLSLVRPVDGDWETLGSVTVRKDGSFAAPYVPAGRVTLQASMPRAEDGWGERVEVAVEEGKTTEGVEIPWHPNPEVVLEVTTADGTPFVGEIEGYASPRDPRGGMSHHFRAATDERGRAVTRALPPGKLMLAVAPRGEQSANSVEIEVAPADNEPIRVRLR
jgi:hypothetical protein